MENIYEFKLVSLRKEQLENLDNVIAEVNWIIVGEDTDDNNTTYGDKTIFDLNNIDSDNFITYEDLTQQMVSDWIKDMIGFGGDTLDLQWFGIKNIIDIELEFKRNQKKVVYSHQFPWASEVELESSGSIL